MDPHQLARTRQTSQCVQPVLLRGRVDHIDGSTGELIHRYTTSHEPGGVLPIACKTRRATRCLPCAETYRADTYQLIRAGLSGGKGIPATVATHPAVFLTLTAPSFGVVHARRERNGQVRPCRPRRKHNTCPHGQTIACTKRHDRHDTQSGEPLCPDCYDYTGTILFNAHAPELWRRFTIALHRALARQAGLTVKALRAQARISYAKVAEYQRRGVVHFHAIIRIDGPAGPATPPPAWATLTKKRLAKLTAREIRVFITQIREQCMCCKHGDDSKRETPRCCAMKPPECCQTKLSARMVQSIHAVLRNALECAMREEVIPRNVAKLVKVTTPRYKINRGLTTNQARAVLRAAADHRLYALYVLALYLGLRRGELLGLRWADIDLDGEKLEVVQPLQRAGGQLRFVPPKTEDSARTVPLPKFCVQALREHRKCQFAERSHAWPNWDDHGLIFPSRRGTPMEPDNLRRSWSTIRQAAGIGAVRFHDLRHTCVTLLLDLGVPPHIVREIVGHSDIEVTMTIYAHVSLDDKREALKRLGDALG